MENDKRATDKDRIIYDNNEIRFLEIRRDDND